MSLPIFALFPKNGSSADRERLQGRKWRHVIANAVDYIEFSKS